MLKVESLRLLVQQRKIQALKLSRHYYRVAESLYSSYLQKKIYSEFWSVRGSHFHKLPRRGLLGTRMEMRALCSHLSLRCYLFTRTSRLMLSKKRSTRHLSGMIKKETNTTIRLARLSKVCGQGRQMLPYII